MIKKNKIFLLCSLLIPCISHAKDKVYHVCSPRDSPTIILSCSVYAEARGEGLKGMWGVGNVVLNRRRHQHYPDKIRKVIYQKGQFTYTKVKVIEVKDKKAWEEAKKVSKTLIILDKNFYDLRHFYDITDESIFFYRRNHEPKWMKKHYTKKLTYKGHVFYGENH